MHLTKEEDGGSGNFIFSLQLTVTDEMFEPGSILFDEVKRLENLIGITVTEQINLSVQIVLQSLQDTCLKTEYALDLSLEREVAVADPDPG